MIHSVRVAARMRQVTSGRPKPTEKRSTLTLHRRASEVVAVLVHHDQHAQRDDEGDDGMQETHAACPMQPRRRRRARLRCARAIGVEHGFQGLGRRRRHGAQRLLDHLRRSR